MFPSMASDSDDPNRSTTKWKPGDPTPRTAIAAFALVLIVAVLMIVSGFFMLTAQWDRAPANETEAEAMQFVLNNTRILGGINLVIGAALAAFATDIAASAGGCCGSARSAFSSCSPAGCSSSPAWARRSWPCCWRSRCCWPIGHRLILISTPDTAWIPKILGLPGPTALLGPLGQLRRVSSSGGSRHQR